VHIRFVQFSFERDWFCMDLPRQTLSFPEAMEVLWYQTGFFCLCDREQFTLHGEPEGYDLFRKTYIRRVTNTARARDLRDLNSMLCQLSYDHQVPPFGGDRSLEGTGSLRR
jgi:hypothetical protein